MLILLPPWVLIKGVGDKVKVFCQDLDGTMLDQPKRFKIWAIKVPKFGHQHVPTMKFGRLRLGIHVAAICGAAGVGKPAQEKPKAVNKEEVEPMLGKELESDEDGARADFDGWKFSACQA